MSERLYLFTRFERFWHWAQAGLTITLLFTGFAIHGSHELIGFRKAVEIHEIAAWLLIALWGAPSLQGHARALAQPAAAPGLPRRQAGDQPPDLGFGPALPGVGKRRRPAARGAGLQQVAAIHTLGAFLMLAFLIIHIYLATVGRTPLAHIKAMITGWEEVHEDDTASSGISRIERKA